MGGEWGLGGGDGGGWWWGGGGMGGANAIEWDKENTSIYKWIWNANPNHLNIFAS